MIEHFNQKKTKSNQNKDLFQSKNDVISKNILDKAKKINEEQLINKGNVEAGLRLEDAEYLGDVQDMEDYLKQTTTFENLPLIRLAREQRILSKGPEGLNGCKKASKRRAWFSKQKKRVKNAAKLVEEHEALLAKFNAYKAAREKELDDQIKNTTSQFAKMEQEKLNQQNPENQNSENQNLQNQDIENKVINNTEYLTELNSRLATDAIWNIHNDFNAKTLELDRFDEILDRYIIVEDKRAEERKKAQEKEAKNRSKKAEKTGKIAADQEIFEDNVEATNQIFEKNEDHKTELETKVKRLEGEGAHDLKDLSKLFKEVMEQSTKPFAEDIVEVVNGKEVITGSKDISANWKPFITSKATALTTIARKVGIDIPQEMYSIIQLNDNELLRNKYNDFKPEENIREAFVLLTAATSKIFYDALNRFAGYTVSDGLKSYWFNEDLERKANNYDIMNKQMVERIRNIRDMSAAYADAIRRNREEIASDNTSLNDVNKRIIDENNRILNENQPSGLKVEKKKEEEQLDKKDENQEKIVIEEKDPALIQQEIYEEWERYIEEDIVGTEHVDDKDMKMETWIVRDYKELVLNVMKNNPQIQSLRGAEAKRYIIALNSNLNHNLKVLNDELPKTSIGKRFNYIPRMKQDYIEHLKQNHFGMLLTAKFNFKELLKNNALLKDFFDKPIYKAAQNRQKAIMKAINEALKLDFYTNTLYLSDLWANKSIQDLLLGEPLDKEEQEEKAKNQILEKDKDKKKEVKEGNILTNAVQKLLSNSADYGTTDNAFKETLEKIKANVKDNIAVIDRKISLMGICDTAKAELKRDIIKRLGADYLLGYSMVSQDIVEYTIDHIMAYSGHAAEIQRSWDRKFARTGLPSRLSIKIERLVAAQMTKDGKIDQYYLKPKGYKVSKEQANKREETEKKTHKIMDSIKALYQGSIKDFLKNYVTSQELRDKIQNVGKLYTNDRLKLTKAQWDMFENYFETEWLKVFQDDFTKGKYKKEDADKKLNDMKSKLTEALVTQLENNFRTRQKIENEGKTDELKDFYDKMITREEFTDGLNKNAVIDPPKTSIKVINDDINNQIFSDPALARIFKSKDDRALFIDVLAEELENENSALHALYPYLEDVRSIEQVGKLGLIDYSQFFADIKAILTIPGENADKSKAQTRLLLDEWRMSGQGGGDIYGVKKKLLKDFFSGNMNSEIFTANLVRYKEEALKSQQVDKMRLDAILQSDEKPDEVSLKFNYLDVQGKMINQNDRVKKLAYAQKLWSRLHTYDTGNKYKYDFEAKFTRILNVFITNIEKKNQKKPAQNLKDITALGKILDKMILTEEKIPNEPTKWVADSSSISSLKKSKFVVGDLINRSDLGALKAVKDIFKEIAEEDPHEKKLTFSDCIGEILMYGFGKEYFEAGGAGESVFLKSENEQYATEIVNKSLEIARRREGVQKALDYCKIDKAKQNEIIAKLKPVIAGLSDVDTAEAKAENIRKFGVENGMELINRLLVLYGTDAKTQEVRDKSKELGDIYKARRDYIDNYGTDEQKGKFRIVRDFMMKDQATWNKIMTLSDDEFVDFMKEQDRIFGKGLDVFNNKDYRGSKPISEQYIMSNWSDFKNREQWDTEAWEKSIGNYYNAFMYNKVQKKTSIVDILNAVQTDMTKAGIDKSDKQGTILQKMSIILAADPANFTLLYSQKDMFEAVKKIDQQYKENIKILENLKNEITEVSYHNKTLDKLGQSENIKGYTSNPEDDALLKEISDLLVEGEQIAKIKKDMGSMAVLRQMEEKAKKGKAPTKDDIVYADYSLLMQILKPHAFNSTPEQFKATLLEKFKEYKHAQGLERNANIYSDRSLLDTKDAVRLDIQIKKNQGKMLENEYLKEFVDYREQKDALGSIGLIAYQAVPKNVNEDSLKKARKFVDKNIVINEDGVDQEFIKGLLVERAIAFGLDKESNLKVELGTVKNSLINLNKALKEKGGLTDEEDIKKAMVFAFAQNASRIDLKLDGTHEGDIKEIAEELKARTKAISIPRPESAFAQRDYDDFMEEINMARYTMKKEEFILLCDKKRKYYELVDACALCIKDASTELRVNFGLFEYFKKDIYEALQAESDLDQFKKNITEQISKLIGDGVEGRNDLSADKIRELNLSYLPDSNTLMQRVSSDMVTAEEKLLSSQKFTREDVEKEITMCGKEDIVKMYNSLTVEEQKVFAIVLTFPDIGMTENERLTSNEALKDKIKENQNEVEIQKQIAAYLYGDEFSPKIDYNLVMRRLMKTDKKTGFRRVSKTMFEKAFKYTQFCAVKKNELREKDFAKLSDGRYTGELGRTMAGKSSEQSAVDSVLNTGKFYGAATFRDFFANFAKSEVKEDKSVSAIAEKLGKYNNVQMYMLIHVLQDRTACDYTTAAGKWDAFMLRRVGHVNAERRDILKSNFLPADGIDKKFIADLSGSVKNNMFLKAAETLFSYQLRDDIDLENTPITKECFAKEALERKTKVDWKLLERAMSLVEETEKENLRIQMCRQTVEHTMDENAPNINAKMLGKEIEEMFKDELTNHNDYFRDFLCREAKKNQDTAIPLISAYQGLSENEKMLVIHALKHRDILDISKDGRFTTAIGQNENRYVNEVGRNKLADYYIDHLAVPGAQNVLATTQYDVRDAMKSLISTQVSDTTDELKAKTFVGMMEGQKIFNFAYIGTRSSGVDWELFANAIKFAKKTEGERKLLVGNAESYRAAGDINKYGRFMYNYQFLRKNMYRSGYRLTRFFGRRVRAELEGAIPGYGFGQRIMMMCLSPEMKNKMLDTGIVKPAVSKNATTDYLGYAGLGGVGVSAVSSALSMVSAAAQAGTAIAGESLQQTASGLSGIFNITKDVSNILSIDNPVENEEELEKEANKKIADGSRFQNKDQQLVTQDNKLNKDWILNEVANVTVKGANYQDILSTATDCINVLSGSSFGVQALTNYFVFGIRAAISEIFHVARFITSVCVDKKMMEKYFADNGPLGKEIQNLRGANFNKIIHDQNHRKDTGSREILDGCDITMEHAEPLKKMSNAELFRKAYGFKDFSEQASYVGWNIVQTLMQSASPFGTDPLQFVKASLLLAAIGCKDCIGKQDNDSAQKVYNRLMGVDIR